MLREWLLDSGLALSAHLGYEGGRAWRLVRESECWSADHIRDHQTRAIRELMRHCHDHVPYYRDLMRSRGLGPEDFRSVGDVAKLPYLTKDLVRAHSARMRADNIPDAACLFRRSGGTTGEPVRVAADRRCRSFETATYLRGLAWMKARPGRPTVRLFGGSLGIGSRKSLKTRLVSWAMNDRFLPAFEITPENARRYHDVVLRAEGGSLVGYGSAILNLVEYMGRAGLRGSPLASVIYTAEHVPDELRRKIGDAFQAPVFAYYGGGEIHSLGYECDGETGYLVPQEHVLMEAATGDPSRFCEEGRGEACVTALYNYAMPMIRYLPGDVVTLGPARGGRAHQRITLLEGRVMDQLSATDGHLVSSALPAHFVLRSGLPVWKYQVVQNARTLLEFHYLTADEAELRPEHQAMVRDAYRKYLGQDLQVKFVRGAFETMPSGKHRFVINRTLTPAPAMSTGGTGG